MPKIPRLPDSIVVGPKTYTVITDPDAFARMRVEKQDFNMVELTDTGKQTIHVSIDLGQDTTAECLFHAALHASLDAIPDLPEDVEERVVSLLGLVLLQVIRDNPDLVAFLRHGH